MSTSTKRPSTISQTTGSYASGKYYRTWSSLNNLKTEASFADCGVSGAWIGGKNGTYPRPAPLKLTNFGFNIPTTAKISKITVYYRHYKPKLSGAYPSFNAPTIDLLNVSADAKKGAAVPTSSTEYSVSWTISPSASKVNSSSFGVSINYPANSNTNPGQLRLRNVRIVVTYTNAVSNTSSSSSSSSSSSGSTAGRVSGTSSNVTKAKVYPFESVDITLTISASANITSATKMYIAMPEGVEYLGKKSGNGSITNEINPSLEYQGNETYCWLGNFSNSNKISITFTVRVNTLGTKNLTFREPTTAKTTITKLTCVYPPTPISLGDFESVITTEEELEFTIICNIEEFIDYFQSLQYNFMEIEKTIIVTFPNDVTVNWDDEGLTVEQNNNEYTVTKTLDSSDNTFKCFLTFPDIGKYTITITDDDNNTFTQVITVKPSNLTFPYYTKMIADEYVRDRLGNSKEYTLSSLMKIIIDPNDEDLIEYYEYNYRLGVFNTALPEEISESIAQTVNIIDTSCWKELEGRNTYVTIENNGIKGNSVCVFGLNTEFINIPNYTITFELYTTTATRVGVLLFGDPSSTLTNKNTWYGIITDIRTTFIEEYDSNGNPTKLFTASKNYFRTGANTIKIVRMNETAIIYINGEMFYTFNNLTDCYNTIGFQKWGGGHAKVSNIEINDQYAEELNNYLLENAEWSEPISAANTWEDIKVNFFYSEDYPLIFLITGEYIESLAEDVTIEYTYPCLIEQDYRDLAEQPGIFEYPIKEIPTDEGAVSITLKPREVTNIAKAYDVDFTNFLESDEDNRIIQGCSVYFDVISCDNPVSVMCKLVSPSFTKEGNRSVNIESVFLEDESSEEVFSGTIELGGTFDLWGLDFDDFRLSKLEDLEIDLQFINNFSEEVHMEFNNLYVVFHYVELEEAKIIAQVNGVDLRYFNVFIQDVIIKPGTNNDVKYLDVEGTDSNLAYRSNIREKEIEMEIRVPGCDVEETTNFVERLARTLANKRDKFNNPTLNRIEFSHHPNKVFEYILEDSLDVSAEYTEYEGKIKLIVPSGTAYSKEPTITNATGTNNGIAKVNPIIRLVAQDTSIIVKETFTNQEWRLNDDTLEIGDLLRIDCGERKVYKVTSRDDDYYLEDSDDNPDIDITNKVDFNSDWFLIHDDYNFECENTAVIQSVSFYERW